MAPSGPIRDRLRQATRIAALGLITFFGSLVTGGMRSVLTAVVVMLMLVGLDSYCRAMSQWVGTSGRVILLSGWKQSAMWARRALAEMIVACIVIVPYVVTGDRGLRWLKLTYVPAVVIVLAAVIKIGIVHAATREGADTNASAPPNPHWRDFGLNDPASIPPTSQTLGVAWARNTLVSCGFGRSRPPDPRYRV
jgi:hypothetical protein